MSLYIYIYIHKIHDNLLHKILSNLSCSPLSPRCGQGEGRVDAAHAPPKVIAPSDCWI